MRVGPRLLHCRPVWVTPLGWLALQAAALWPHGLWAARRLADGSDDPLGLAAAGLLALLLLRQADRLRVRPRGAWLASAVVATLAANLALVGLPPLAAAMLAALALAFALAAWLPEDAPRSPYAGLVLLSLPLIASLQFYAGYPLRVITAEASAWILRTGGLEAVRSGVSMLVQGQLVVVDAPCSGVQMAWLGYFSACAVAAWLHLSDAAFWRRLPLVGAIVLGANVLRNSLLVALEARPHGLSATAHEAIGLVALVAACAAIVAWMQREERRHA
ncbi:MAG: exosortase Q [Inhella sp.]|nr:exosortase Q [Inhella sp.]